MQGDDEIDLFGGDTLAARKPTDTGLRLEDLDLGGLLDLRERIDQRLPAKKLVQMDLEEELVIQLQTVKALQQRTSDNVNVPANQKSQIASTCATILAQLTKLQAQTYDSERFKQIEQLLIDALNARGDAFAHDFLNSYEELLKKRGLL